MKQEIIIPIYREKIYIASSIKDCKKIDDKIQMHYPEARKLFKDNSQQGKVITFSAFNDYCQVVYIFPQGKNRSNVMHESLHICVNILERRGIKVCKRNQEVIAYLQEYVYKEICKKIKLKP